MSLARSVPHRFHLLACLGLLMLVGAVPGTASARSTAGLTIGPSSLPPAALNVEYVQQLTVSGGDGSYTCVHDQSGGPVPSGMTVSPSCQVRGTPYPYSGFYSFIVTATDGSGNSGSIQYTNFEVRAIRFSEVGNDLDGQVGVPYSKGPLHAYGDPRDHGPYTWALVGGSVPPGLTFTAAGVLSGTPTAAGTYTFSARARDADGITGVVTYQSRITAPAPPPPVLALSPADLPAAVAYAPYSATVGATGGTGPYSFSVTAGALPGGVTLDAAGALAGTPEKAGTYIFTVAAKDAGKGTGSKELKLVVAWPALAVTPAALPEAVSGTSYSAALAATGGKGPYVFGLANGELPRGLTLKQDGTLDGTPSAPAGTFTFTVAVLDANGAPGAVRYTLTLAAPEITLPELREVAAARIGHAYYARINASGGEGPYAYTVAGGKLPTGLVLTGKGFLRGKPSKAGTFRFTVKVTDRNGATETESYRVKVAAKPKPKPKRR